MPRNTLVIGVGGTGSKVLFWLKKDLMETHGAEQYQEPGFPVKLLLVDTAADIANPMALTEQQIQQLGGADVAERFGGLEDHEIRRIPTDPNAATTRGVFHALQNHPLPDAVAHLDWLAPITHFPDHAIGNLINGAAQFRQLGRLSLAKGLHLNGNNDPLYQNLQALIAGMPQPPAGGALQLDVHVVGSFVGGTGSGIFLDVALLVRHIVEIAMGGAITLNLFGHFALSGVITAPPADFQQQRTYNAWRELNRFMNASDSMPIEVTWRQGLSYELRKPLYTNVYLLDKAPAVGRPEHTAYPMMAEAISFFVDEQAGGVYIQHIITNLAAKKNRHPYKHQACYSAYKVRSWKRDTYHYRALASHQFALGYLTKLLNIEQQQQQLLDGNPVITYVIGDQIGGKGRATEILVSPLPGLGNTRFIQDLNNVINIPQAQRDARAQNDAENPRPTVETYATLPATPENEQANVSIQGELTWEPSQCEIEGRTPQEIRTCIDNVNTKLYGPGRVGGEYVVRYGAFETQNALGRFYKVLKDAESHHMSVFQERVWGWVLQTLNDPVQDGGYASGLATTKSALEQMSRHLESVIDYYHDVLGKMHDPINLKVDVKKTSDELTGWLNALGGLAAWFINVLGAISARVQEWHEAERYHNDVQRNRRGIQRIIQTLTLMKEFVDNSALREVRNMERQLVTGDAAMNITSVYRGILASETLENYRYGLQDGALGAVISRAGGANPNVAPDQQQIDGLIARTQWTMQNGQLTLSITVDQNLQPIHLATNLVNPEQTFKLVGKLLNDVAPIVANNLGADGLTALDVLNLADVQDALPALNGAAYTKNAAAPANPDNTFYIRALSRPVQLQQLNNMLNILGYDPAAQWTSVVTSENPDRVVVFKADEVQLCKEFKVWAESYESYAALTHGDPLRAIIPQLDTVKYTYQFKAEIQAFAIENAHYAATHGAFTQTLEQRLVQFLSYDANLTLFLRLWVLGCIELHQVDNELNPGMQTQQWRINTGGGDGVDRPFALVNLDFLSVMANFVVKRRDLNNVPLNFRALTHQGNAVLLNNFLAVAGRRQALLNRVDFEIQACNAYAPRIRQRIQLGGILPAAFQNDLEAGTQALELARQTLAGELHVDAATIHPLARYIAKDFTEVDDQNNDPLVSNKEAHLQMLEVMLPILLGRVRNNFLQTINQNGGLP